MGRETVSKNLKELLEKRGITQAELSRKLEISEPTVSSWVNGRKYPRRPSVELLADFFKVKPSDITDEKETYPAVQTVPVIKVPVVSKVSAGLPIYSEQNIVDHIFIADIGLSKGKEHFGLIVSGDSMDKEFKEDDVVIVEKDAAVETGQIGVVMINGYNATVKRVSFQKDMIILQPESNNSSHQPQIYSTDDEVRIIGKVVGMHRIY